MILDQLKESFDPERSRGVTIPMSENREEVDKICNLSDATAEILPLFHEMCAECEELAYLSSYKIKFLFNHKPKMAKGKLVLGSAKPFPPKDKLFHDWDAVVTFDLTFWESCPDTHKALFHHELSHFAADPEAGHLISVTHDISEFFLTIKRYGDYLGELRSANAEQLELALNA